VPLGLTDGAALAGGAWVFSAVAQQADGTCVGSAVGVVGPDGVVRQVHRLQGAPRVEGLVAKEEGDEVVLTLVTDPGNPAQAAQVLQARFKLA
jgi:hypothetical protein